MDGFYLIFLSATFFIVALFNYRAFTLYRKHSKPNARFWFLNVCFFFAIAFFSQLLIAILSRLFLRYVLDDSFLTYDFRFVQIPAALLFSYIFSALALKWLTIRWRPRLEKDAIHAIGQNEND